MASLAISKDFLVLTSSSEATVVVKSETQKEVHLSIPQFVDDKSNKVACDGCDSDGGNVQIKISASGRYLAICPGKKLTVWNTEDWSILSSRDLVRISSNIAFTPKEKCIVVADKSGDVYTFSLLNQDPGQLILGHLSVILDVLVTNDEKYVITCDRDEKIRVSNFPNSYNIHCFCLGHKEFVSCIKLAPQNENILISGSGDGTVKFWKFLEGAELSSYSLSCLPSDLIPSSDNSSLAVSNIEALKVDSITAMVCLSIVNLPKIIVLSLMCEDIINCNYHTIIDIATGPISFIISDLHLWLLYGETEAHLSVFQWLNDENKFSSKNNLINDLFPDISARLQKLVIFTKKQDPSHYLYKKKYDNVQEYLVKKKARIEASL